MLIFLISLSVIYVSIRIYILFLYLNMKVSYMERIISGFAGPSPIMIDTETSIRWSFLYTLDSNVKRIGSILITIISLIVVSRNYAHLNTAITFILVPYFIQLFNYCFEWIQVDSTHLQKSLIPRQKLFKQKKAPTN